MDDRDAANMPIERHLQDSQLHQLAAETSSCDSTDHKDQMEKLKKDNKDLMLKMVNLTERMLQIEKQTETFAMKVMTDCRDRDLRIMQESLTQVKAQAAQLKMRYSTERPAEPEVSVIKSHVDSHDSKFAEIDLKMAKLDLQFQILETTNYDGTLLWKLRDYTPRKQDAVKGHILSLYSQPFYTHKYGYKMCARVYLNGDGLGKGSHLSLFFVVMCGEYDNLLPWPFQQPVTMILLNQENGQVPISQTFKPDPTNNSFQKPTSNMNTASGFPQFVSHTVLETPKYIKDDVLMIKIHVNLENLNHP